MAPKRRSASDMWDESLPSTSTANTTPVPKKPRVQEAYVPDASFIAEPERLVGEREHDESDPPCRTIDKWMLYHRLTGLPVSLDALLADDSVLDISATGDCTLFVDNTRSWDEWDDSAALPEQTWTRHKLSRVVSIEYDYCGKNAEWDSARDYVWLKTKVAWYALGMPCAQYREAYPDAGLPYRAVQGIVRKALECPGWGRLDYERWTLTEYDYLLGRVWLPGDLRSEHADAIRSVLDHVVQTHKDDELKQDLKDSALVQGFLGPTPDGLVAPLAALKVRYIVNQSSRLWFRTPWHVLSHDEERTQPDLYTVEEPPLFKPDGVRFTPMDQRQVVFSEPFPPEPDDPLVARCDSEPSASTRFNRADCGPQYYVAHDIVRVAADTEIWIARIAYFYIDDMGDKCFHAEWLDRAAKSLGKVADQAEMFVVLLCDKVPLASIIGPPIALGEAPTGGGSLFCRSIFDGAAWVSLNPWHAVRKRRGQCFVKAAKTGLHDHRTTHYDAGAQKVWARGVEYHRYDFVFLRPKATDVSVIAQIRMVRNDGKVQVAVMDRGDADGELGERCLSQPGDAESVTAGQIVGRCRLVVGKPTVDELIADPWLFYTEQALGDTCSICEKLEVRQTLLNEAFEKDAKQKLQMLDPFCGAGGLTAGIERGSRCIKTKFAVDADEEAAKAFAKNHRHATVFHGDANSFLSSLDQHTCIPDINGREICPADREHGRIDVICAGPPCQGHSTLNSHRTADDPKNCLVLTALSLVEHIRPRYLVIENVVMIMGWRLMAEQRGQGIIRGGETHGGIFLITAILLRLGYQVRIGLLNAGMHGTPQNRRRFFLLAADSDSTLPDFPHPTHAFPKAKTLKMRPFPAAQPGWPVDDGEENVGDDEMRLPPLCVPHPRITVGDAIGDLKGYNWSNPERQHNAPSFPCDAKKGCNPSIPNAYARNAAVEFQVRAREKTDQLSAKQLQHVTAGFKEYIVKNVWDIPIRQDDDGGGRVLGWTAINPGRRRGQYGLADPTSHVAREGMRDGRYYRRLKMNEHFATLVTNVRPTAKQSQVLHPNQHRLVSVREQARAQGFPDDFKFVGNAMAMQRQIGNAVPVTLAEAIGRELRKSMFADWLKSPSGQKQCDIIDEQLYNGR